MEIRRIGKIIFWLLIVLLIAGVSASVLRGRRSQIIRLDRPSVKQDNGLEDKTGPVATVPEHSARPFFVSGWLPYWAKSSGADSLSGNLDLFSEIDPFAFGVNADGSLRDTLKIADAPWPELQRAARNNNVAVIPTILWADAVAMHRTFSDRQLAAEHIGSILAMLEKNDFPGVDIDYEGKDVADRDPFSAFLAELHDRLRSKDKLLKCTVEARTQDAVPEGLSGTRAMSYANDFAALEQNCDQVRIMAYDQMFQINRSNTFEETGAVPAVANADDRWVEKVIEYALRYISPEKLSLGIPTYGWEFSYSKTTDGYRYTRVRAVSYPGASAEARAAEVTPQRDAGGELSFAYRSGKDDRIVTFSDAESVRRKIALAQKYDLAGAVLFKLDGLSDPETFSVLKSLKSGR